VVDSFFAHLSIYFATEGFLILFSWCLFGRELACSVWLGIGAVWWGSIFTRIFANFKESRQEASPSLKPVKRCRKRLSFLCSIDCKSIQKVYTSILYLTR
jgi:hypothetical protein